MPTLIKIAARNANYDYLQKYIFILIFHTCVKMYLCKTRMVWDRQLIEVEASLGDKGEFWYTYHHFLFLNILNFCSRTIQLGEFLLMRNKNHCVDDRH